MFLKSEVYLSFLGGEGITRKGNLSHYYFRIAGLLRGQNQPVNQVIPAVLLKYVRF